MSKENFMNTNIIACPRCKAEIPLTDAMAHQVRVQMENEFAIQGIAGREALPEIMSLQLTDGDMQTSKS